jgi:TctA family transporter
MILGPMAEQEFRQAMITSQSDVTVFVTHPLAAALPFSLLSGVKFYASSAAKSAMRRFRAH